MNPTVDQNKIRIGMGGWELHPFNKYFYPSKPKKGFRKLAFYSQFFDTIEINATFYNTSFTPVHSRRWLEDVSANRNFLFTVKLFKGFTHTLTATRGDVLSVHRMLEPMAQSEKLGGVVIQFPYSFTNLAERRQYLTRLARAFHPHRLFVEVRHNSWNSSSMYNFFRENGLHLVNVDLPVMKRHMPLTSTAWDGAAYFRMMGRNSAAWMNPWRVEADGKHIVSDRYHYLYNRAELEQLFSLIELEKGHSERVFMVFHNDPDANSLINGFQLRHLARQTEAVSLPPNFVQRHPLLKPVIVVENLPLFAKA